MIKLLWIPASTRNFHIDMGSPFLGFGFCLEVMGDGESAQDSPRDEALQNISADDLPDSASQAAHPQDAAFSYRYFVPELEAWGLDFLSPF